VYKCTRSLWATGKDRGMLATERDRVVRLSIEVEDRFRRDVKTRAASQGLTVQQYVQDAVATKMAGEDEAPEEHRKAS